MSFLNVMKLYPLALLVTWLPRCLQVLLVTATILPAGSKSLHFASYFYIFSSQYGTLTALIYFSHSSASRMLWMNLLKRKFFQYLGIFTGNPSEVTFPDEYSDSAGNMEDALVNRAMIGGETASPLGENLSASGRDSLPISMRESATTNNIIIQLAGSSNHQYYDDSH
jgi:hypothetical protein